MAKSVEDLLAEDAGQTDFTDAPSEDESKELTKLCNQLSNLEDEKSELEARLKDVNIEINELSFTSIPRYADKIGQDKIGLPDANADVVVSDYFKANIKADWPEEDREKAFDWLETNGVGDVIKSQVHVSFTKEELDRARELLEELRERNFGVQFERSVPWNTLTSLVREMVGNGEEVPLETLGAQIGRQAKLKKRKK